MLACDHLLLTKFAMCLAHYACSFVTATAFGVRCRITPQGILWVLDMYLASDCPDYRFTYEREGPSAGAVIGAAAAGTAIRRKRLPQVRAAEASPTGCRAPGCSAASSA
jgi:hypothetical protein